MCDLSDARSPACDFLENFRLADREWRHSHQHFQSLPEDYEPAPLISKSLSVADVEDEVEAVNMSISDR